MATPRTLKVSSPFLQRVLDGHATMLCDGGMGTLIQQAGLSDVHEVPDLLNLSHPDEIRALQRRYVDAGSDCIATNTFSSNRLKLAGTGCSVAESYEAAARIARSAGAKLVAGDIGPTGALLEPMGELSFDEAYDIFAEQAQAAQAAGCDLVFIETFADLLEAKAAVLACRDSTDLPVFCTMTFLPDGRTFMGTTPAIAATTLSALGADAVGVNCSVGPFEMVGFAQEMAPYVAGPLMAQPNAGLPRVAEDGLTVYDIGAEEFGDAMTAILEAGATVVGGCCGTTPEHVARLRALLDSRDWASEVRRDRRCSFIVASAQEMVELADGERRIAVIGERINPTGKPRLKEALLARDYDLVISEAVAQAKAGASILDVNVGVAGIDEAQVLVEAVRALQASVSTPLQLDSADPEALERACRVYAGRPLINSVNGKAESLERILPIAARYGAAVIGLTLDEKGIPASADGRMAIARRILEAAADATLAPCDLAIDCLVMSAATNQGEVFQILEAMRACKDELRVRTALGVSNVSFGLPARAVLNASFLTAALAAGLDLPIIDPLEPRYQDAIRCFEVINGQDEGCRAYVEAYVDPTRQDAPSAAPAADSAANARPASDAARVLGPSASDAARALFDAIVAGRQGDAARAARQALDSMDVMAVASEVLSPALDEVGARYEAGSCFLPQLMASAEAAKAAFDVLAQVKGDANEVAQESNALPIVLATVEGDIHDIGKNIVRMLLENYGFKVIDLGKNVAPQKVVDAVRESGARLVGLSALMTTTLGAMERTVALLGESGCDVVTMVGGAVLSEDYARRIGADRYVKDAQASVRVAQEVLLGR